MKESSESNKIGAVLVVGGGIGGIQASLDLAELGFKVYLVDRCPAMGGVMAQLDKTFPTNDCSMCILSPKLVECGRHLNIELITCADVLEVQGEPGNFRVSIRKRARYVDPDRCTGCGDCVRACPVEVSSEFDEGLINRKAIYRPYAQAVPNVFAIDKKAKPPCRTACPLGTNVQGYIALIAQGKFEESFELIKEVNALPVTCGRICTHPCEVECERGRVDEPLAIRALKRFATDYARSVKREPQPKLERAKGEKVALIGSGPAGLTCAHDLAKMGYEPTIFETLPEAGGMLRVGIPEYRLPKNMLQTEIEEICSLGVEIKTNTPVKDLEEMFNLGYKAIFLGTGAQKSQKMGIPGEEAEGVIHALDFLKQVNLGGKVDLGDRVAIIGGGNAAIDAARVALRLGAKDVAIIYRRSRAEMPAIRTEIKEAEREGVKIHFLAAPVRVLTRGGRLAGIECIRMGLGEPDASGRPRPIPIKGSEFTMDVDNVIIAIGQVVDRSALPVKLDFSSLGTLSVDPVTFQTNIKGVFAGGDVIRIADVVSAMAAGKEAAISIDRYLRGVDLREGREARDEIWEKREFKIEDIERKMRKEMPMLRVEDRIGSFDEVERGFTEEMAKEEAIRCLNCGVCSECRECVKTCQAEAINHGMKEEIIDIEVGAVILAPGFNEFNAELKSEYGYGRYSNVITSIEFERILSASGPFGGRLLRPSDGNKPRKIAFIQCVGSRDHSCGRDYCSSICCMYATKEAVIAKEHMKEVEPTIFYIDMRAFGKDFDKYVERAKSEHGVRYVRARVACVEEVPETKNLKLRYEGEDGQLRIEEFHLVVLSVGLEAPQGIKQLAETLDIRLNKYDFCETNELSPMETSRPGVFVCGVFSEPKDIPETVTQASGAAAEASGLLASARGTLIRKKEYPPEIDVQEQEPRIGVFVCHCGINIGGYVDVSQVVEYVRTIPNVVYAEDNLYTCSQDTQERIREKIREHNLNRVVVASCTPLTHEPLFRETVMEAGLNPYLFEMANIREQCSWMHMDRRDKATEKAKDLVRMAVAKARLLEPLKKMSLSVTPAALVVGGGISGMVSALSLAEQGFKVHLVEKNNELGGIARKIHCTLEEEDIQVYLADLIRKVSQNPLVDIHLGSHIVDASGYVGNFTTTLVKEAEEDMKEIKHGVAIIAIGGQEYKPTEYLYGKDPRVLTLLELEEELINHDSRVTNCENLVIIQCVGSRDDERPYCSRVCCGEAIKCALRLKEINPEVNIYILYRDIRTYGFKEDYYQKARAEGLIFIRYEPESKPEVRTIKKNGKDLLRVVVTDPILGEELLIDANILALAVATIAPTDNQQVSQLFRVPLNEDGFFLEAHAKLRPVDFAAEGIFLCGLAHSPKFIEESIAQAKAVASRAATILVKDTITAEGIVCSVNDALCSGCGICEVVCPYSAIKVSREEKVAKVNEVLCKGCGTCCAACPSDAAEQRGFTNQQILAQINACFQAVN